MQGRVSTRDGNQYLIGGFKGPLAPEVLKQRLPWKSEVLQLQRAVRWKTVYDNSSGLIRNCNGNMISQRKVLPTYIKPMRCYCQAVKIWYYTDKKGDSSSAFLGCG